jgi:hypothetical protein
VIMDLPWCMCMGMGHFKRWNSLAWRLWTYASRKSDATVWHSKESELGNVAVIWGHKFASVEVLLLPSLLSSPTLPIDKLLQKRTFSRSLLHHNMTNGIVNGTAGLETQFGE